MVNRFLKGLIALSRSPLVLQLRIYSFSVLSELDRDNKRLSLQEDTHLLPYQNWNIKCQGQTCRPHYWYRCSPGCDHHRLC